MLKKQYSLLPAYCLLFVFAIPLTPLVAEDNKIYKGNVGGYTRASAKGGQEEFNAGFSFYSAAWPLQREYPGRRYRAGLQSGLFGTWMGVQNDRPSPIERFYTKIEGGLGWWRDTEYGTETPKFLMGGVALNFSEWAKKQACWKGLEDRELIYPEEFDRVLISPDLANERAREAHADKAVETSVEAELEVHRLGAAFWAEARNWARERGFLSPRENGVLETCAAIPSKMPSDKQCAIAMGALRKLRDEGFAHASLELTS